jgi:hypothetical protein
LDPWRDVLPPLRIETAAPIHLRPAPLTWQQIAAIPHRLEVSFDNKARLIGYDVDTDTARPGGQVSVRLFWQALTPMNEDYAVFIHLVNSAGTLSAQLDSPRGVTHQTTRYWKPGDVFSDTYPVDIPATAYAPDDTVVRVGLYLPGGSRLTVRGAEGQPLGDSVSLSQIKLLPRPGTLSNPADVNFGHQLVLLGYDLNTRVIRPGETLSVTLYWQAYVSPQRDYAVFMHLSDLNNETLAANDGLPYTRPKQTSRWQLGQVMQEVRPLYVSADVPPGPYNIQMGVFEDEGRLPIITADPRQASEQITLVQVRVVK